MGVFWPKHPGRVNPEETDYAKLTGQIIDAINGITTYNDSELIFTIFQNQDDSGVRTLIHRLKERSGETGTTPDTLIEHLFGKLSANHREALKDLLIANNIIEDLVIIVAREILTRPLSEGDINYIMSARMQSGGGPSLSSLKEKHVESNEMLHKWLIRFRGPALDELLLELEKQSGKSPEQTLLFIFENLDTLPAEKVRAHLFTNGTLKAADYALKWTVIRINNLLDGYTGTLEAGEWLMIASEVIAGGLVGIVTGGVEFTWDLFQAIMDIPTGVYHYFMTLLFISSKGSIGSDSILIIEELIRGIEGFAGDPRAVLEMAYEQTMQESEAFEGPGEAFQRAEYWSRKTTKFIVTVVTIVRSVQAMQKGLPVKGKFELGRTGHIDDDMEVILDDLSRHAGMSLKRVPKTVFNPGGHVDECAYATLRGVLWKDGRVARLKENERIVIESPKIWEKIEVEVKMPGGKTIKRSKKQFYVDQRMPIEYSDIPTLFEANGYKLTDIGSDIGRKHTHEALLDILIKRNKRAIIFRHGKGKDLGHVFEFDDKAGRFIDYQDLNPDYMPLDNGEFEFIIWEIE